MFKIEGIDITASEIQEAMAVRSQPISWRIEKQVGDLSLWELMLKDVGSMGKYAKFNQYFLEKISAVINGNNILAEAGRAPLYNWQQDEKLKGLDPHRGVAKLMCKMGAATLDRRNAPIFVMLVTTAALLHEGLPLVIYHSDNWKGYEEAMRDYAAEQDSVVRDSIIQAVDGLLRHDLEESATVLRDTLL